MSERNVVRVAAVADVHCRKNSAEYLQPLFAQAAECADILVLPGDLTDYGHAEEAQILAHVLSGVRIPIVAVFGNHDFESGQQDEIQRLLCDAGVTILDGETTEIHGVGFAGVKGFAGGFGRGSLGPWGEEAMKAFVREALDEALKLESALARLRTERRVAVLHYSPIQRTVEGEPCEIYPFLGSSRLADPLLQYPVSVVFHGHAHNGAPEGQLGDTPVYNVALPLLRSRFPDRPFFRVVELEVASSPHEVQKLEPEVTRIA